MKIVYGGSGTGKSRWMYNELKKYNRQLSQKVCLIVPEQFTLEAEQDFLTVTGEAGIFGFEVTSFSHLMDEVIQAFQPAAKYWMNDLGKVLVLDQVLAQSDAAIGPLKRLRGKPRLLQDFYQDLMDGKWQSQEIRQILESLGDEDHELAVKLKSLQCLLLGYERELAREGLVDQVVHARIACDLIRLYQPYQSAVIFIDQFWGFSSLELEVMEALEAQAKGITVLLTGEASGQSRIFEPVEETLRLLKQRFPQCKERRMEENPEQARPFMDLNRAWMTSEPGAVEGQVEIVSALQAEEEVRFCAAKMLEWKAQGIPYDQMQVIVSDYPAYLPVARRIFQESEIPVHLDHNRMIGDFPAAQAVLFFLRFQEYGSYDDLLSAMKAGYFRVSQAAIDRLEISIRQRGWTRWQKWQHELLLKAVAGEDTGLGLLMTEGGKRRKKAAVDKHWDRLCAILKKCGYYDRFQKRDNEMETEGLRLEHQSIWRGFQAVVEQMTAMHGDQAISASRFRELFALGCALIRVGVLPAVCGEATVRDFVRSRSMEKRCTVFLGMNEGAFPVMESPGGFFDFEEREWLADHDLRMGNTRQFNMAMQDLAFYQAIAKTQEKILFLWSRKDQNYDDLAPSGRLVDLEAGGFGISSRMVGWQDLLATGGEALRFCSRIFRRIGDGKVVAPDQQEQAVACFSRLNRKKQDEIRSLLHYGNQVDPLKPTIADALYQNDETSITELELLNQCPFAHFLSFGIQPREVKAYRIEDPDVGQVLHDLMEMGYEGYLNGTLDADRLDQEVEALCQPYFEAYREGLFFTSQTNQYIGRQIRFSVVASLRQLILQKDQSLFQSIGQEMRFGNQPGDMKPLAVSLESGRSISVCGRIDRVDRYETEDHAYVQVIDYKSGRVKLDKAEMMEGIHLQLPTYLNVCGRNQAGAIPAGFFHYYLDRPLPLLGSASGLQEQMRDFYRMRGFFLGDRTVVTGMDRSLLDTGVSKAVAVRLKKDGSIQSTSQMLTEAEMGEILNRNQACIQRSIQDIHQGVISIAPYEHAGKDACASCSYGAICQFDPLFKDNKRRRLIKAQGKEASSEVD